jgi:hypothetical protein
MAVSLTSLLYKKKQEIKWEKSMKLARKILKNCAKILMSLKETIHSKDFLHRHRKSETHFSEMPLSPFPS